MTCSVTISSKSSISVELAGNTDRFLPANRRKGLFGGVCTVFDAAQLSGLWQENLVYLSLTKSFSQFFQGRRIKVLF